MPPQVGYCQGLNFVAGLLLQFLPERHAFGGLVVMMSDRGLRAYYSTDMSLLQVCAGCCGRARAVRACVLARSGRNGVGALRPPFASPPWR